MHWGTIQKLTPCGGGGPCNHTLLSLAGKHRLCCLHKQPRAREKSIFAILRAHRLLGGNSAMHHTLFSAGVRKPAAGTRTGQEEDRRSTGCGYSCNGLSPALAVRCKQNIAFKIILCHVLLLVACSLEESTLSSHHSYPDSYLIYSVKQGFSGKDHVSRNY